MLVPLPFCYAIIDLTKVLCLGVQVISKFLLLQLDTTNILVGNLHAEQLL